LTYLPSSDDPRGAALLEGARGNAVQSSHALHSKGLFLFKAQAPAAGEPVLDEMLLLSFLRSIAAP